MKNTAWTKDEETYLLDRVGAGVSVVRIAGALDRTEQGVRFKLHVLRHSMPEDRPRRGTIPPVVAVDPLNLKIEDLHPFHCRYVTSEEAGADATYCGHATWKKTSWCQFHYQRVFTARVPAKDQRPTYRA